MACTTAGVGGETTTDETGTGTGTGATETETGTGTITGTTETTMGVMEGATTGPGVGRTARGRSMSTWRRWWARC